MYSVNKSETVVQSGIKKETLAQVFSCEYCEISKKTFSTEQLRKTASVWLSKLQKTKDLSGQKSS